MEKVGSGTSIDLDWLLMLFDFPGYCLNFPFQFAFITLCICKLFLHKSYVSVNGHFNSMKVYLVKTELLSLIS